MENLSLKNILWVISGTVAGYVIGSIIGPIIGVLLWAFMALILGDVIYHSPYAMVINTLLSSALGVIAELFAAIVAKRLLGNKMSFLIWGVIGLAIGLAVMFSYGTYFLAHPEIYITRGLLLPRGAWLGIDTSPAIYSDLYYGAGTGYFIVSYVGAFAGFVITIRELILKKRNLEDKKQFDEYSKFFEKRLKK